MNVFRNRAAMNAYFDARRKDGGGLLGLEAARGLARRGLSVEVVHARAHLMERQLDVDASRILVQTMAELGVAVRLDAVTEEPDEMDGDDPFAAMAGGNMESGDDLYDKALAIVARDKKASTSYIQRRLQIGYNRAASLIERMEQEGVVSSPNHKGVREVLLPDHSDR